MTPHDLRRLELEHARSRDRLIQRLSDEGIHDQRVLKAIHDTPRHLFVDEALAHRAWENNALPIGQGQTISQPYIVARMTELLLGGRHLRKVLEVGTGSGYQSAVLSRLVSRVCSLERIQSLQDRAKARLELLGLHNLSFRWGDGWQGWPAMAPFDGIIVTAAATEVPQALLDQLAPGGRMVIPVGDNDLQQLLLIVREGQYFNRQVIEPVRFVPMLGGTLY